MILGATDPEYLDDPTQMINELIAAGMGLAQIMNEVAASKQGGSGEDLTTILVNSEIDGEKLTESELASFFILLTVAGNETTRNAISWGLKYLTDNPEQRAIWEADFDGVVNGAVEEIVRMASPVTHMRRTATRDVELSGQHIAEGDKLVMYYYAANRDPQVFQNPTTFDVLRKPTPSQIGFGGAGPHFCLGAHLARREIGVMFRELFDRLPDIHASGEPELLRSNFIHGGKLVAKPDIVIRNGSVIDGTGAPARHAEVAITDGIITEVAAKVSDAGTREIDADGRIVTPGFVDIHTHLDAQIAWDPIQTSSCWHGITSAVLGNCGVTFAPVAPGGAEVLAEMMESVEDIPQRAILEGLPWDWSTYGDYLQWIDRTDKGINVGGMVGHSAVRLAAMGDRGMDETPSSAEDIAAMVDMVDEAYRRGRTWLLHIAHAVARGSRWPSSSWDLRRRNRTACLR
ncbi:Methyl-branched lipid omega-hydroxylase [Nymphon striatum]|nr:Methyl-branched lipid omega-hydroxylase [Nymphon striatum]